MQIYVWQVIKCLKQYKNLVRGDGQVVEVLAFYSGDPSLNPADAYSFSGKFVFEKNAYKQKRHG